MSINSIDLKKLPQHIAIIMDGNGRWAKQKKQNRIYGHKAGAETAKIITEAAAEIGIKYLTLYAFSKENWNRPQEEVYQLMNLLIEGVKNNLDTLNKQNIRVKIIGDEENLPENVKNAVQKTIESTKNNTGLTLIIALNYGGRWEIINAVKKISQKVKQGKLNIEDIDEREFKDNLTTKGIPDPDLLIRTSGEYRISNFLLWQVSYSEFYFSELMWPDFKKEALIEAIKEYQKRERRFGKISEQINNESK